MENPNKNLTNNLASVDFTSFIMFCLYYGKLSNNGLCKRRVFCDNHFREFISLLMMIKNGLKNGRKFRLNIKIYR